MSDSTGVVIVNWNSGALLRSCVESVRNTASNSEILIVDNASTDDSLNLLANLRNQIHFVRNSVNRGFAAAVNQGFAETSTPYVLILNPDVRPTVGAISLLRDVLDHRPKAGAVGGYVNDKYLPRDLPTPASLIRQNLGFPPRLRPTLKGITRVEQPAAAALMVRRDAFEDVNGFDERFFPAWYEDVDFCDRLKTQGWEIYFVREAEFLHEGGYSAGVLGARHFADAYYHNQLRYAQKRFGYAGRLAVRGSIAAGAMARALAQPKNMAAYFSVLRGALGGWRR